MIARAYKRKDLEAINDWYQMHGHPTVESHMLPSVGFVVDGVCAGFLFQTDSSMCLLDAYVANPQASAPSRSLGQDLVTNALMERAKDLGYRAVIAITEHPSIVRRCKEYKFKDDGARHIFVKEI